MPTQSNEDGAVEAPRWVIVFGSLANKLGPDDLSPRSPLVWALDRTATRGLPTSSRHQARQNPGVRAAPSIRSATSDACSRHFAALGNHELRGSQVESDDLQRVGHLSALRQGRFMSTRPN